MSDGGMSTAPRPSTCKCGHTSVTHYYENTLQAAEVAGTGNFGPCQATVYTQVHQGVTATRCSCTRFERAE